MAEDTPDKKPIKWIPPRQGHGPEIYANFAHPTWTLFDVRIVLGHLIPNPENPREFVSEELGAVTFAWPHAKLLRDMLTRLVASYEETNGEIKPAKLPPDQSRKDSEIPE
jgi:hypothetical protein